jgi:hypothetical protein
MLVLFILEAVLASDTSRVRLEIAPLPGHADLAVIAWEGVPGLAPGAMVYREDRGASATSYLAVGGGGVLAVVDRGSRTMVAGTVVPVFDVITGDPDHPQRVVLERGTKVDVAALVARYQGYESVAGTTESQTAIDAAVAARTQSVNKACGTKLATQIRWAGFAKAKAYAKQAIGILDAIETTCADKDYRAALAKLTTLAIDHGSGAFALHGATLSAALGEDSWNPRESATVWLKENL